MFRGLARLYKYMTTNTYMTTESTSKVHGHWPVKYAVANIQDRGRWSYMLSPQCYMLSPPVFYMASHRNTSEGVYIFLSCLNH